MGVDIIAQLSRKNGANFPLAAAEDVIGAFATVANTTARDAIPTAILRTGAIVRIGTTSSYYEWNGSAWASLSFGGGGSGDLKSDGTVAMAADLNLGGNQVTNAGDAAAATDLTTLQQVNALIAASTSTAFDWKQSVRAATTAALPANTRVSNVLTANANGALPSQDGVALIVGDRLLVKNEATSENRGIYTVTSLGSGGTPWVLTRAADCDADAEVTTGLSCGIEEGTANGPTSNGMQFYTLTTANPIVVNTTGLTFTRLGTVGADGATLTLSAGLMSIATGGVGTTQLANAAITPAKLSALNITDIAPVDAATTGNITLSGAQTIDGVTLTNGVSRVAVWKQTTASQNGIYLYNSGGAWTRASDQVTASDFRPGAWFFVKPGGAQHGGKLGTIVTPGPITVGTTALTYALLPVSTVDPAKGQSAIFNGTSWTLSGIATRATDLPDGDVSVQVSEGNRFVLAGGTLTASRAGTLLLTGAADKEIVIVERYDVTAFTYAIKNSLGSVLYTFPAGMKRMASFQYTGEWSLLGHMAATSG